MLARRVAAQPCEQARLYVGRCESPLDRVARDVQQILVAEIERRLGELVLAAKAGVKIGWVIGIKRDPAPCVT